MVRCRALRHSTTHRPAPLAVTILAELVAEDFERRRTACEAAASTIWGYGYRACRTPAEQREWVTAYVKYLQGLLDAHLTPTDRPR